MGSRNGKKQINVPPVCPRVSHNTCNLQTQENRQQLNSLSYRSVSFPAAADQRIAMGRMAKPATAPLILFVAVT